VLDHPPPVGEVADDPERDAVAADDLVLDREAQVLGGDLLEVACDRSPAADALGRARRVRRPVLDPLGVVGEVGEPGRDVAGRQRAAEAGEVEARRRGAGCGVGRGRGRSIGARVRRTR